MLSELAGQEPQKSDQSEFSQLTVRCRQGTDSSCPGTGPCGGTVSDWSAVRGYPSSDLGSLPHTDCPPEDQLVPADC